MQGLHTIGIYEYSQSNLQDGRTIRDGVGAGLQWYPRPHFEIQTIWEKTRARRDGPGYNDFAWVLLHYYL